MRIARLIGYRRRWRLSRPPPTLSCGRRTARLSRADFGIVSVCATWALLMRATIFRTAVIIIAN